MVELLEVGTDVTTCLMAGKGMNGLNGTVVHYNRSNSRYTIELGDGDVMSLRPRNIKPAGESQDDVWSDEGSQIQTKESKPSKSDYEEKRNDPPSRPRAQNIFDQFLFSLYATISDMSPSVILISIICGYFFYASGGNSESYGNNAHHHRGGGMGSWGMGGWGMGCYTSGMVSFLVVIFFAWQFGTKKGETKFQWSNVGDRVKNFNMWEVMRFAALLEVAFHFVRNNMNRRR